MEWSKFIGRWSKFTGSQEDEASSKEQKETSSHQVLSKQVHKNFKKSKGTRCSKQVYNKSKQAQEERNCWTIFYTKQENVPLLFHFDLYLLSSCISMCGTLRGVAVEVEWKRSNKLQLIWIFSILLCHIIPLVPWIQLGVSDFCWNKHV